MSIVKADNLLSSFSAYYIGPFRVGFFSTISIIYIRKLNLSEIKKLTYGLTTKKWQSKHSKQGWWTSDHFSTHCFNYNYRISSKPTPWPPQVVLKSFGSTGQKLYSLHTDILPSHPRYVPGPYWFSELPLTVFWKMTPWLSDSNRKLRSLPEREKGGLIPARSVYAPLGESLLASTLLCCESTHRPLQAHSSLFWKVHALTW